MACGWTNCVVLGSGVFNLIEGNIPRVEGKAWTSTPHLVPNYLNDLNAMHEAVASKWLDQDPTYEGNLAKVCGAGDPATDWWESTAYRGLLIHATAAQRAEAFLKTLDLWIE